MFIKLPIFIISVVFIVTVKAKGIFTTVPTTQYVWINTTATFECGTNITDYTLSFSIPAEVTLNSDTEYLPGGGQLVTISFKVTSDNNATSVRCLADDGINLPQFTTAVYVYAQGPPSSVENLTALQQDQCSLSIQWEPPYLLPGLSVSYKVYVNEEIIQDDISAKNYTYYPIKLTNAYYTYNVTVGVFNGSVVGDDVLIHAILNTDNILHMSYESHKTSVANQIWQYHFKLKNSNSCSNQPQNITMVACSEDDCYDGSTKYQNITVSFNEIENYTTIEAAIDLPYNNMYNASIVFEYNNGTIFTTNEVEISTYDIQGISVINVTENGICVGLQIINDNSTGVTSTSHIYIESKGNSIFYTENDEFCRGASLLNHYQNYDLNSVIQTQSRNHEVSTCSITTSTTTIYVESTITAQNATILGISVSIPCILLFILLAVNISVLLALGGRRYAKIKARHANIHTVSVASVHYENVTSFTSTVQLEVQDCNAYGVIK